MKSVGVREFRDQATSLMGSGETLVIEKHGRPIGFFVPITAVDRQAGRDGLGRLGDALDAVLKATGLNEDDLVDEVSRTLPSPS